MVHHGIALRRKGRVRRAIQNESAKQRPTSESRTSSAQRRRSKVSLYLAGAGFAVLLILLFFYSSGVTNGRRKRAEALTARFEQENRRGIAVESPREESSPPARIPDSGDAAPTKSDALPSATPSAEIASGRQLVREMYDFYYEKIVRNAWTPHWRDFLDIFAEPAGYATFEGRPSAAAIDEFARLHDRNIRRLDEVMKLASAWPSIEDEALQSFAAPDHSATYPSPRRDPWIDFETYLMRLAYIRLRPAWRSGDTRAFAREIVGIIPLARMLKYPQSYLDPTSTINFSGYTDGSGRPIPSGWPLTDHRSELAEYVGLYLRFGAVPFHRSDWAEVDWSPLFEGVQWPGTTWLRGQWDGWAAATQAGYASETRTLADRFMYHYSRNEAEMVLRGLLLSLSHGRTFDEMTEWRLKGHEFLSEPHSIEELRGFFGAMPTIGRREAFGSNSVTLPRRSGSSLHGKIVEEIRSILTDPSQLFECELSGTWESAISQMYVNAALKLFGGGSFPREKTMDGPFDFAGHQFSLAEVGEGEYIIRLRPEPPASDYCSPDQAARLKQIFEFRFKSADLLSGVAKN